MSEATPRPTAWWWVRTCLYVLGCAFLSVAALAMSELGNADEHGWQIALILLTFFVALGVPVVLLWRHRAPFAVTLMAAAVAALLPVGPSTALVALAGLVSRRRGRDVWWAAGAVAMATVVSTVRDVRGETRTTSFLKSVLGPADAGPDDQIALSWLVLAVWVVVVLMLAVGSGLVLRTRSDARMAGREARSARAASDELGDRLARQVERERIAREVHDVLGHRLSLVNLHAGALEARAATTPELAASARLVRESARASMDDLRSLLAVLRQPLGDEPADPELSLADLPAVVEETLCTGVPVSSAVFLDGADSADPTLSRAVYRIVQELLTNARKHAPGELIHLRVTGGPHTGVTIDARNRLVGPPVGKPGHGLQGIAERVELLGGRLAYGHDDGGTAFRVTVQLPWVPVPATPWTADVGARS